MKLKFEKGRTFKPFEQLMGVMPAASDHTLPEVFRPLMSDPNSPIIDFYPTEFPIDLNGKKFAWQGVALLPFIDEKRLLDAMATRYPMLSAADVERNEKGKDVLIMSDQHPLYDDIATNFYSKRQSSPTFKLDQRISQGLAGTVGKNDDYLPQSSLVFPLDTTEMPGLEEDHSIRYCLKVNFSDPRFLTSYSVHFEMPKSTYIHKSMLLRGVKLSEPALDRSDIEATKGRANRSGRSHGGAPLRGGGGRGRGGHINYADHRPNPFAAHLNGPPPNGFSGNRGPDPYVDNSYGRGPPPSYHGFGQPPPHGRYNGAQADGHHRGPPPPPPYNLGPPPPQNSFPGGSSPFNGYGPPPRAPPNQYPPYGSTSSYYGHQGGYYGGRNGR